MFNTIKLIALSFILACASQAHANWNEAWTGKARVTVAPQGVTAAVENVPVAVRLHTGNFDFLAAKDDGSDLRFIAADDKTELKYHIEKYDALNELAVIWVVLPKVDPADKEAHFWIYYGNEAAPATADAKATWDAATVGVFHFAEKALLQDSSASALAATGEVAVQKAALLGEAATFSGKPVTIPAFKRGVEGMTWSAWLKPAPFPQQAVLFSHGDMVLKVEGQKLSMSAGKTESVIGTADLKAAEWQHVAVSIGGGKAEFFINGTAAGSGILTLTEAQADLVVGEGYGGEMDELQLAGSARSADWIRLAHQGQGPEGQLLAVQKGEGGEGEGEEGGEASYMGILIDSLTLDAKIVIAILGVMFAISTAVMVSKARLIGRTSKDNRKFLTRFQSAADNLLDLDRGVTLPHSTLFTLYQAGLREIRKREKAGETLALSGASMDAIKAAIDADLVRETQRMNGKMVLLTIAISGGPFLGLLGTVVGVMITFAAIAAAGDVNVNAIAPGIAAALLATVAGLGVAIPALFGYNYLASQIKNITIEMQIFVDEYVTRVAEAYGK
jgi:biopolymer transport protein ExbB